MATPIRSAAARSGCGPRVPARLEADSSDRTVIRFRPATHGRAAAIEFGQQRLEVSFVSAPACDRTAVKRPANLNVAGGGDRPVRFVKAQAAIVPGQAAIVDQPPGLLLRGRRPRPRRKRRAWRRPADTDRQCAINW